MNNYIKYLVLPLILVLWFFSSGLFADSIDLDKAVKKYYAGYPNQAIGMIKPMAMSGDVDAQYLLGNILYGLVSSGMYSGSEDPIKWYNMAAEQNFPQANYALGVVYNNYWVEYHRVEDANLAKVFFQKAFDLGYRKARIPLKTLIEQGNLNNKSNHSLTYTNSSFSSKLKPSKKTKYKIQKKAIIENFRRIELPNDLLANATKIEVLIKQLTNGEILNDEIYSGNNWSDEATITNLLAGYDSTGKLISDLMQLLENLRMASDLSQLPGSN